MGIRARFDAVWLIFCENSLQDCFFISYFDVLGLGPMPFVSFFPQKSGLLLYGLC